MNPLRIICPEDKEVEDNVTLQEFPCVPARGDRIQISGVWFEVLGREFETNSGMIDASVSVPAVVLKKINSKKEMFVTDVKGI